jgi:hypothetical protein
VAGNNVESLGLVAKRVAMAEAPERNDGVAGGEALR